MSSIYRIGQPDSKPMDKSVIGNKAAQLHYITRQLKKHANVPPAFVVTGPTKPGKLRLAVKRLDAELVSVRSSPAVSMPGMLETKLNVPPCHYCISKYITEVFDSMGSERARAYREMKGLGDVPMGVVVQRMVFGDETEGISGSGVLFTKDPNTGENYLNGEWVPGQQGDVLVSGAVTPENIDTIPSHLVDNLYRTTWKLLECYAHPLDIEFTIERGVLFILQVRELKVEKKKKKEMPALRPGRVLLRGKIASTGVATGFVVNSSEEALSHKNSVLLSKTTTTDDMPGMSKALAFVTGIGGYTCHAAVVARSMSKPAIVGVGSKAIATVPPGQKVYVDGYRGTVQEV